MNNFCGSPDLERSYCFKIPNAYRYYEENNYEDGVDYHNEDNIDVGNTIKMSKKCDSNWRPAGSQFENYDISTIGKTFCEVFSDNECENLDPSTYDYDIILLTARYTLDGYTTVLNCPQCGCTDGTYDVENFFQMFTGEATTTTTTTREATTTTTTTLASTTSLGYLN